MSGMEIGKWVIIGGISLVFIGFLIWLGSRLGIPFGKLPLDVTFKGEKFKFSFPFMTSIIISIILTIILNLFFWIFRK